MARREEIWICGPVRWTGISGVEMRRRMGDEGSRVWWGVLLPFLAVILLLLPAGYRLTHWPTKVEVPGQVVIQYMAWGNRQQLDVERDIIDLFNAKCAREGKNVKVELFMPPAGGYEQKMRLMLASDTMPDVIRADHYYFPSLVIKGYFKDLTELWQNDPEFDINDFHPAAMSENYFKGRLYGLNALFGGVICYYNKDLFLRAGLRDPYELWKEGKWTWEEFEHAAEVLTERDAEGKTVRFGFMIPAQGAGAPVWAWSLWVWREGGEILSPDRSKCLLDSDAVVRAFDDLRDMRFKTKTAPSPSDTAASAFTFESGNIAMEFNFAANAPRYRENIHDFQWDIVSTPSPSDRPYTLAKGNQLVMAAKCKHPKEAWEWMKFMTSAEVEQRLHGDTLRRGVPARKSVLFRDPVTGKGGEYLVANQAPFHTDVLPYLLAKGKGLPIDATWPVWTSEVQTYVDELLGSNEKGTREILHEAATAVNDAIGKERKRLERYME